ncbi:MAG: Mov34/MPN/PAD [Phycisphaerales bacterium]|nr:Mov34/MPN/PAD [Phycisphaerales bacterium]MDB5357831.1 Mov34/MPN/PAD [Phycisphaerales bacterium]
MNEDANKKPVNVLILSDALRRKIESEGVAAYPNECCGILIGRDVTEDGTPRRVVERLEPGRNVFEKEEQYHRFSIDPAQQLKAERAAEQEGKLVLGYYHSHPDHPARPSEYDRQHAWPFYSYVIVAIAKSVPADMTSWVLDDQTETFGEQKIETEVDT